MSSLSPERLNELEQLARAATAGPWHCSVDPHPEAKRLKKEAASVYGPDCLIYSTPRDYVCLPETWERQRADARFIVAAREAVPALLSEVRALRERVEELSKRKAIVPHPTDSPYDLSVGKKGFRR